ncbi:MAG: hypothetical protein IPP78_00245 [Holophagaceae bacterium]|nr:hypothetical protein [Holophagaceae bacterium]
MIRWVQGSLLGLVCLLPGCGGGGGDKAPAPKFQVGITPSTVSLVAGGFAQFNGTSSDGALLNWRLLEPNSGDFYVYPYSNLTNYSAPGISGTYRLQATHPQDPNSTATVTITVRASGGIWGNARIVDPFRHGYTDVWYTHAGPTLTVLANGTCLITGGADSGIAYNTALLLDLSSGDRLGVFTATGPMSKGRMGHTATLLKDGRVLLLGGVEQSRETPLNSAEVYNPSTKAFTRLPDMGTRRAGHQATLLADGKVLVTGGVTTADWPGTSFQPPTPMAELFDPALNGGAGGFVAVAPMGVPRYGHTATAMTDGRVLITGGVTGRDMRSDLTASMEIWDPVSRVFQPLSTSLGQPRARHSAVLLPSGKVLVAGGYTSDANTIIKGLTEAWLFDPAGGQFTPTGSLQHPKFSFGMVVLLNGTVLALPGAGGYGIGAAEVYTPATGAFSLQGFPASYHQTQRTTGLLPDGRVVVTAMESNIVYSRVGVYYP